MSRSFASWVTKVLAVVASVAVSSQSGAVPSKNTVAALPVSRGKVVLRLPYHGGLKTAKDHRRLGLFEGEIDLFIGNLVAADWEGNFYIFNPTMRGYGVLNCYSKQGKWRESWGHYALPICSKCSMPQ